MARPYIRYSSLLHYLYATTHEHTNNESRFSITANQSNSFKQSNQIYQIISSNISSCPTPQFTYTYSYSLLLPSEWIVQRKPSQATLISIAKLDWRCRADKRGCVGRSRVYASVLLLQNDVSGEAGERALAYLCQCCSMVEDIGMLGFRSEIRC